MDNGRVLLRDGDFPPREISRRRALMFEAIVCGLMYAAEPRRYTFLLIMLPSMMLVNNSVIASPANPTISGRVREDKGQGIVL